MTNHGIDVDLLQVYCQLFIRLLYAKGLSLLG
jgi:hypothetical protein